MAETSENDVVVMPLARERTFAHGLDEDSDDDQAALEDPSFIDEVHSHLGSNGDAAVNDHGGQSEAPAPTLAPSVRTAHANTNTDADASLDANGDSPMLVNVDASTTPAPENSSAPSSPTQHEGVTDEGARPHSAPTVGGAAKPLPQMKECEVVVRVKLGKIDLR